MFWDRFTDLIKHDERAIIHRYKATRASILVGLLVMSGWFYYDLILKKVIRWDFLLILVAMALTKIIARIIYSRIN